MIDRPRDGFRDGPIILFLRAFMDLSVFGVDLPLNAMSGRGYRQRSTTHRSIKFNPIAAIQRYIVWLCDSTGGESDRKRHYGLMLQRPLAVRLQRTTKLVLELN